MNGTWLRSQKASELFGVHPQTLRRWADQGTIEYKKTHGGQRIYRIDSGSTEMSKPTIPSYIYVRVSSNKQKDDLERQASFLQSKYPNHLLIKDIGSGLNFKRKGLIKLLERSNQGQVKEIVVASKDRLCRFGFDLLQWQFSQNNTELLVLDQTDKSPEQEFTEDILAILQVFSCRWNGKRKYTFKNKKDQITIDVSTEEPTESLESSQSLFL